MTREVFEFSPREAGTPTGEVWEFSSQEDRWIISLGGEQRPGPKGDELLRHLGRDAATEAADRELIRRLREDAQRRGTAAELPPGHNQDYALYLRALGLEPPR